jgi:hypothetical protein
MTIKILIIIILLIFIFTFIYKKREYFSNEALETIVSMYNNPSSDAKFNNITTTGTINTNTINTNTINSMNFKTNNGAIIDNIDASKANVNIGIGTKDKYMYIAPRTIDNTGWDYTKGIHIDNTGDVNILGKTTIQKESIYDASSMKFVMGVAAGTDIDKSHLYIYPRDSSGTDWNINKGIRIHPDTGTRIMGPLTQQYIVIKIATSDADYIENGNFDGWYNTLAGRVAKYFTRDMPDGTAKHFLGYIESSNEIYPNLCVGTKLGNRIFCWIYHRVGAINNSTTTGERDWMLIRPVPD